MHACICGLVRTMLYVTVCMYVCMHACMYVYMHVHIHACICGCTYVTHTCRHLRLSTYQAYVYMHACVYVRLSTYWAYVSRDDRHKEECWSLFGHMSIRMLSFLACFRMLLSHACSLFGHMRQRINGIKMLTSLSARFRRDWCFHLDGLMIMMVLACVLCSRRMCVSGTVYVSVVICVRSQWY